MKSSKEDKKNLTNKQLKALRKKLKAEKKQQMLEIEKDLEIGQQNLEGLIKSE